VKDVDIATANDDGDAFVVSSQVSVAKYMQILYSAALLGSVSINITGVYDYVRLSTLLARGLIRVFALLDRQFAERIEDITN